MMLGVLVEGGAQPIRGRDEAGAALGRACGLSLDAYRAAHVERCVARALTREGVADADALAQRLQRDERARARFRRSVLVPVTSMFRDRDQFELLDRKLLPALLARRARLDVWSAGCSRGDELRSVAALLERHGALEASRLLGTDVLDEELAVAARSRPDDAPAIRSALRFERRDLLADPPPSGRFDLVLCRNVGIYLERDAQRELHLRLAAVLRPGGLLMLGRAETILRPQELGLEAVTRHVFRGSGS